MPMADALRLASAAIKALRFADQAIEAAALGRPWESHCEGARWLLIGTIHPWPARLRPLRCSWRLIGASARGVSPGIDLELATHLWSCGAD